MSIDLTCSSTVTQSRIVIDLTLTEDNEREEGKVPQSTTTTESSSVTSIGATTMDETSDYFGCGDFWDVFLSDEMIDHAHLLNVFVTVLGESHLRESVICYFLGNSVELYRDRITCEKDSIRAITKNERHYWSECDRRTEMTVENEMPSKCIVNSCLTDLNAIKSCWLEAQSHGCLAVLTWRFPSVINVTGEEESHYITLVCDPFEQTVMCIDSRGVDFAEAFHPSWQRSLFELKERVFRECAFHHYCFFDLQSLHPYDHFCQTWSLVFLRDYLCPSHHQKDKHIDLRSVESHFDPIANLWRELVLNVEDIREEVYYQIYRHTHDINGERHYNRYFSILEEMVTGGRDIYYPAYTLYRQTGYTFLETFVTKYLTGKLMHQILVKDS